jgi:hypothetical protein
MKKKVREKVSELKPGYVIPVEGSLGLLALGDEGLQAWRRIRDEHKQRIVSNEQ